MINFLYISGPISGKEDTAKERFGSCEKWIIENTYYVPINPYVLNPILLKYHDVLNPSQDDYMRVSYFHMTSFPNTSIVLLPGWEYSVGARKERFIALELNYKIMVWEPNIPTIRGLPEEMRR